MAVANCAATCSEAEAASGSVKDRLSVGVLSSFPLEGILKRKLHTFRDVLGLPGLDGSLEFAELMICTLNDLQKMHPYCTLCSKIPGTDQEDQVLLCFYKALLILTNLWTEKSKKFEQPIIENVDPEILSSEQLGQRILKMLECLNSQAKEISELVEVSSDGSASHGQQDKTSLWETPVTPTSVLPERSSYREFPDVLRVSSLYPLRFQAVRKLKPIDIKRLSVYMSPLAPESKFLGTLKISLFSNEDKMDSSEVMMVREPISQSLTEAGRSELYESSLHGSSTEHSDESHQGAVEPSSGVLPKEASVQFVEGLDIASDLGPVQLASGMDDGVVGSEKSAIPPILSLPILKMKGPMLPSPTPAPPPSPMTPALLQRQFSILAKASLLQETNVQQTSNILNQGKCEDEERMESAKASIAISPAECSTSSEDAVIQSSTQLQLSEPLSESMELAETQNTFPPSSKESVALTPPPLPSKGSQPSTPQSPVPPLKGGAPPPPPPLGAGKALRAKKSNTKLKRSTQMGKLYRLLMRKVEGSSLTGQASRGKIQIGGSSNKNKEQGMADALAEMTKRSAYFQQIEQDVEKHSSMILELQTAMNSFCMKDMDELIKFYQHLESQLETLTDETQVLSRFEGFPLKKLENIRMAAALHSKLNAVELSLKNWKIVPPFADQLHKIECYFTKIKEEVDALERTKDEQTKQFKSYNIQFDFNILLKIRELMVDLSSNFMEMVLKESKEAKIVDGVLKCKPNGRHKMLWRAFELAFRVYNFAGGQDDRADRLTSKLAEEIESIPLFE